MSRLSVLLATEEAYPFHRSDAGAWGHTLTTSLPEVDFTLLAVTAHPYVAPAYICPANVRGLITVPLGGTEDPAEYGNHPSFPQYLRGRWSMTDEDVRDYAASYEQFLREVTHPTLEARAIGLILLQLHLHLRYYDYHLTQSHPWVWDTYLRVMKDAWRTAYPLEPLPLLADLVQGWQLLQRLMLPLAVEIPAVDLTHSAAAGFCGLPCVVAKLSQRIPYVLTENGIYLRDEYLTLARATASPFVRWLLARLLNTIADVNYAYADQLAPACEFSARWEQSRGVEARRIRVIYHGADPERYRYRAVRDHAIPTVISIGNLHPANGQVELMKAAALVHRHIPDAVFRFYGAAVDERYRQQCDDLVRGLDLMEAVTLAGPPPDTAGILEAADVVAFPRASDAIPHALFDAMMSGAGIVATDIGGIREALGDTGMLVPAHDPVAMAEAITALLRSPNSRRRLGEAARERTLQMFTADRFVDDYRAVYKLLVAPETAARSRPRTRAAIPPRRKTAAA